MAAIRRPIIRNKLAGYFKHEGLYPGDSPSTKDGGADTAFGERRDRHLQQQGLTNSVAFDQKMFQLTTMRRGKPGTGRRAADRSTGARRPAGGPCCSPRRSDFGQRGRSTRLRAIFLSNVTRRTHEALYSFRIDLQHRGDGHDLRTLPAG